jgi:hypothetical protein
MQTWTLKLVRTELLSWPHASRAATCEPVSFTSSALSPALAVQTCYGRSYMVQQPFILLAFTMRLLEAHPGA